MVYALVVDGLQCNYCRQTIRFAIGCEANSCTMLFFVLFHDFASSLLNIQHACNVALCDQLERTQFHYIDVTFGSIVVQTLKLTIRSYNLQELQNCCVYFVEGSFTRPTD